MPKQVEQASRSPICAQNKMITTVKNSLSCDDPEPFHFAIKPNAVNDEENRGEERAERAGAVDRLADGEINPDTPRGAPERQQRREKDKDDAETFE